MKWEDKPDSSRAYCGWLYIRIEKEEMQVGPTFYAWYVEPGDKDENPYIDALDCGEEATLDEAKAATRAAVERLIKAVAADLEEEP